MSLTGSLIPYVEGAAKKQPKVSRTKERPSPRRYGCCRLHLNSLWSIWYGICLTGFQSYLAAVAARRFLGFVSLSWPQNTPPPRMELHAVVALVAAAALLLPFFMLAAIFKIGNLANDGFKLGRNLSTCSADPPSVLIGSSHNSGVFRSLWQHGGPTAPFLHLTTAFCLLLPRLLMEARLIQAAFLSKECLWKTDLDFMVVHRDRLVILNFFTSPPTTSNISFVPTPLPFASTTDPEDTGPFPDNQLLQDILGPHFASETDHSISLEFLNYALALVIYAVRYPSVFWNTNKCFGVLFSFQLLGNAAHALMSYAGMSVLYKVQVLGASEALPTLKKTHTLGSPFLLDAYVTLALFILSSLLVLSSSLVLYLYGLGRFNAFLKRERDRRVVVVKEGRGGGWGYFTHCAALCVLLALAVCYAPLLHDYTVVYRGSLDGAILACVVAAILHLFLWVVVWLILTVKQHWIFRLRITVGRAAVRSARSIKLLTDVDLVANTTEAATPLLVVGGGRTYTVADTSPKKAIMGVIQKSAMERKARLTAQGGNQTDDDTDIYWLRPKPRSPKCSPSDSDRANWFNKSKTSSHKLKVTFDEAANKQGATDSSVEFEDDGDYATLRMNAPATISREDTVSEENKLLERVLQDESVTFLRSKELQPDYEDPSPLLTPDPTDLPPPEPVSQDLPLPPPPPDPMPPQNTPNLPESKGGTPRCLRRADSGMHDELTPRSGSVSSGSASGSASASGGSPPGAHGSESSSGVHSNGSSRRATSVDDLTAVTEKPQQWRSCSLQRNVPPPGAPGSAHIYAFGSPHKTEPIVGSLAGVPAVILENPEDNTVVIRRKALRPRTADLTRPLELTEEPFGRSTNMRMTSFTDEGSSATLPHFPTQVPPPPMVYPCNTMPLSCPPIQQSVSVPPNSCHAFPRPHTTLPTHLNGVKLFPAPLNGPYAKRLQHAGAPRLPRHDRDSANFSMSGDSDSHS